MLEGKAMPQDVSRWLLTAETRVIYQTSICEICGWQSGTGNGFFPRISRVSPLL